MGHSNAPNTYYSTLHNSITSLCKTILPLGLKKRCLVSAEHRLSKLQCDNLNWQQESFQQMLKLIGLCKDEILPEAEVSAFRTHLLDTILSSPPPQQDHSLILRHKLLFLQELLDAKCISEGEYHSTKRPLLQRLVAQGGNIEEKDVVVVTTEQNSEEEWSVIDLKDDQCLMNKENSNTKKKSKKAWRQIKGATTSVFSLGSSYKHGKNSMEKSIFDSASLNMHSAHSQVSSSKYSKEINLSLNSAEKCKRKPFKILFQREKNKEGHSGGDTGIVLKKGRSSNSDDEIAPLSLNEKSDSEAYLATCQLGEGSEIKLIKSKLHFEGSAAEFCRDEKVSGDKIKKELSIVLSEPNSTNTNVKLSYGGGVLNELEEENKEQMCEDAEEKYEQTMGWTTFEDDQNIHPNLFVGEECNSLCRSSINPFSHS